MMLLKLCQKINHDEFELHVVSLMGENQIGEIGEHLKDIGVKVYALGMTRGVPNILFLIKLIKLIKKINPDTVQNWMYHANLMGFIAATAAGVKNIVWGIHHSNFNRTENKPLTLLIIKLCKYLSRYTSKVICCSYASYNIHQEVGYYSENMVVIPNGINIEIFKPNQRFRSELVNELKLLPNTVLIGNVSRWDPLKDHRNLLTAFKKVTEVHSNSKLLLCGAHMDQSNPTLNKLITDLNLHESVILLGKRLDVPRIMAALDIFVLSSSGEGFPNVVGEAMSSGAICVSTDVGDCSYMIGNTGIIVPARKPEALSEGILSIMKLPKEKKEELEILARKRVEDYFSLDIIVKQYENLYKRLSDCK